jgi:hypothetical protein
MYSKEEIFNKVKIGLPISPRELPLILSWLVESISKQEETIKKLQGDYERLSNNRRGSSSDTRETIQTTSLQSKHRE